MKVTKTYIEGLVEIDPPIFNDQRGKFVKIYHEELFKQNGLSTSFAEEYYSVSSKNVLRGLHFQLPPYDHIKCVTCIAGKVFDVVIDLRKNSKTYKQHFGTELSADKGNMLYIPAGFAHGFFALTDNVIFLNRTSTIYNGDNEGGIKWDSAGIKWPSDDPIISEKDIELIKLEDYKSPF